MSGERPQPMIVAFEEDPSARERIESELRKRYGADYEVVVGSVDEARQILRRLEGSEVVLVIAGAPEHIPALDVLAESRVALPAREAVHLAGLGRPLRDGCAAPGRRDGRHRLLGGTTLASPRRVVPPGHLGVPRRLEQGEPAAVRDRPADRGPLGPATSTFATCSPATASRTVPTRSGSPEARRSWPTPASTMTERRRGAHDRRASAGATRTMRSWGLRSASPRALRGLCSTSRSWAPAPPVSPPPSTRHRRDCAPPCVERHVDRGPGRHELADPQLPGFPAWGQRAELAQRAYEQAWLFGAEFVYGLDAVDLAIDGDRRAIVLARRQRGRRRAPSSSRAGSPIACSLTWRAVPGGRRLLRRRDVGGCGTRRRRCRRRRWWQLCGAGSPVSRIARAPGDGRSSVGRRSRRACRST